MTLSQHLFRSLSHAEHLDWFLLVWEKVAFDLLVNIVMGLSTCGRAWLKGAPHLYILFPAIEATSFGFNEHEHLKSNTRGATLIPAIITEAKLELARDDDIVESLRTGSFETGSCIADRTTALASQLFPTASKPLTMASAAGQLTTMD